VNETERRRVRFGACGCRARWSHLPAALRRLQQSSNNDDSGNEPIVAHLYPIVVRDKHDGGKVGQGFKAQKRTWGGVARNGTNGTTTLLEEDTAVFEHDVKQIEEANEGRNNDDSKEHPTNNPQQIIEPFPTSYWLTHPLLHNWVSQLEVEGFGRRLEERLQCSFSSEESSYVNRMRATHEAYGQERWNLLTEPDRQMMQARGWTAALQTGVAGNHYQKKNNKAVLAVKCLHAHTAHRLAGHDNLVGQWVLDELVERQQQQQQQQEPPPPPITTTIAIERRMQM